MHLSLDALIPCRLISAAATSSTGALGTSTTENGLTAGTGCKTITIIFARVTEQHFEALASVVGTDKRTVRGIDYLASVQGFPAGGDANGSKLMAQLVSQAKSQCLNSKVVVSGSSQGGQLVHNAANLLNASTAAVASSVVICGDPNQGTAVTGISAAKTLVICDTGDSICQHGDQVLKPHLTYSQSAIAAANFVAKAARDFELNKCVNFFTS